MFILYSSNFVERYPSKPAIGFYRTISRTVKYEYLTFQQLADLATDCAGGFTTHHILTGDHLLIYSFNCVESFVMMWAAFNQGIIPVPLSPYLSPQACEFMINFTQARALILSPFHYERIKDRIPSFTGLRFILLLDDFFTEPVPIKSHKKTQTQPQQSVAPTDSKKNPESNPPIISFTAFMRSGHPMRPPLRGPFVIESRDFDETALLFHTAGTTAFPKVVVASHVNVVAGVHSLHGLLAFLSPRVSSAVLPVASAEEEHALALSAAPFSFYAQAGFDGSLAYRASPLSLAAPDVQWLRGETCLLVHSIASPLQFCFAHAVLLQGCTLLLSRAEEEQIVLQTHPLTLCAPFATLDAPLAHYSTLQSEIDTLPHTPTQKKKRINAAKMTTLADIVDKITLTHTHNTPHNTAQKKSQKSERETSSLLSTDSASEWLSLPAGAWLPPSFDALHTRRLCSEVS